MNRALADHKRTSLDLSESSSSDGGYRRGDYRNDSYSPSYSPDGHSLEGSLKPTPKSILRDTHPYDGKFKKNITINERLNETHRIAQKIDSNGTSPEKVRDNYAKDERYKHYIHDVEASHASSYGPSPDKPLEGGFGSKYGGNRLLEPQNRLVVGSASQGFSDFQRAHVRKLQQEREQELFSNYLKDSADQIKEKWAEEKERRSYIKEDDQEEGVRSGLGDFEKSGTFGSGQKYRLEERKPVSVLERTADPALKFDRIEEKISHLEKDLNSYSKNLVKSTLLQEEKNKNLTRVYEDFEDKMNDLKEEINQSMHGARRNEVDIQDEDEEEQRGLRSKGLSSSKKLSRSRDIDNEIERKINKRLKEQQDIRSAHLTKGLLRKKTGTKKASTSFKKLMSEVERLKFENDVLKDQLHEKELKEKERTKKIKEISRPDVDREKELIEQIDRIKRKLRRNITKKVQKERERQIVELKEEAAAASFGRNYTNYGFHYKDVLKRKQFEDYLSNKENFQLLHKGLPVTYKSYENPIQAEKLTRSTKV